MAEPTPAGGDPASQDGLLEETREKTNEPRMYRVVLVNDHYTTMDFVVMVLMKVFLKYEAEARRIMFDVHRKGRGVCGVYTRDIALTKTDEVCRLARENEFPLRCECEPE
jgi:ATP-dependent Clp protease adaptor protein ClpS